MRHFEHFFPYRGMVACVLLYSSQKGFEIVLILGEDSKIRCFDLQCSFDGVLATLR